MRQLFIIILFIVMALGIERAAMAKPPLEQPVTAGIRTSMDGTGFRRGAAAIENSSPFENHDKTSTMGMGGDLSLIRFNFGYENAPRQPEALRWGSPLAADSRQPWSAVIATQRFSAPGETIATIDMSSSAPIGNAGKGSRVQFGLFDPLIFLIVGFVLFGISRGMRKLKRNADRRRRPEGRVGEKRGIKIAGPPMARAKKLTRMNREKRERLSPLSSRLD